ncbi:glycine-rich domain-containing protein [Streptomyces sp. NPDC087849]|uniref:glycine-rich domain-containing protein n=1 Tax=Streptomyces sp. NPDC087849 TaxID=3365808 RepID=UPI003825FBD9
MATAVQVRDPRTCVSPQVWEREVQLIMRDHAMERDLAERIFGQAVAYLVTSAERPEVPMGPAQAVDLGVHSFVLDSINYMAFCDQHAGRYIHHVPQLPGEGTQEPPALRDTVRTIRASGFEIDAELWTMKDAADCTQCHAGCTDSPNSGK